MNGREILTTAVEGGIGYWSQIVDAKRDANLYWTSVTLAPVEDGDFKPVTVTATLAAKAAKTILQPRGEDTYYVNSTMRDWIATDNIDAGCADAIVQLAAFGEVVYG